MSAHYHHTDDAYGVAISCDTDWGETALGYLTSNLDDTYSPNRDVALHLTRLVGGEVADWATARLHWPVWKALFDHVLADK